MYKDSMYMASMYMQSIGNLSITCLISSMNMDSDHTHTRYSVTWIELRSL